MAVREQALADPLRVEVGHLATEKIDLKPHLAPDRTATAMTERITGGDAIAAHVGEDSPDGDDEEQGREGEWRPDADVEHHRARDGGAECSAACLGGGDPRSYSAPLPGATTSSVSNSETVAGPSASPAAIRSTESATGPRARPTGASSTPSRKTARR